MKTFDSAARPFRLEWAFFVLALVVGAAVRFWALGDLPSGIYHDEAFYGLDAVGVLNGFTPIFFPANNGREPLYIYLLSASIGAFGRTPFGLRLASALIGTLTIAVTYLLGRALFNRRIGLLAMWVCALTFWPVALSRVSFRAGALPLFLGLAIALGWLAVKRRSLWLAALGGAAYGLAFNTYTASRVTPVAILLFGVAAMAMVVLRRGGSSRDPARAERETGQTRPRDLWRSLMPTRIITPVSVFTAVTIIVTAPLALYAIQHPAEVFAREGQVSIFATEGGNPIISLLKHLGLGLGMFGLWGDSIARHNLPGRPVFDLWTFVFFALGVIVLIRQLRKSETSPASAFTLIWLAVMLMPTVLAEDTPHFLRAIGLLPVLWLAPAIGMEAATQWAAARWPTHAPLSRLLVPAAIGASGLATLHDYFGTYVQLPVTRYYFESAATELALEINERPGVANRIDDRLWDNFASLRFLITDRDGNESASRVQLAVWPYEPDEVRAQVLALPTGSLISARRGAEARGDLEASAYSLYTLYRAEPAGAEPVTASYGESVRLRGTTVADRGGALYIRLGWSVESPVEVDYRVFVHILAGDEIVAQHDGEPLQGLYHFSWLRPGDILNDEYVLPKGDAVRVGVYAPDGTPVGEPVILK